MKYNNGKNIKLCMVSCLRFLAHTIDSTYRSTVVEGDNFTLGLTMGQQGCFSACIYTRGGMKLLQLREDRECVI